MFKSVNDCPWCDKPVFADADAVNLMCKYATRKEKKMQRIVGFRHCGFCNMQYRLTVDMKTRLTAVTGLEVKYD